MTRAFAPITPAALDEVLADRVDVLGLSTVRVAVDGPPCADPHSFAVRLVDPLRVRGHETHVVAATTFWKDAALRLEHGREDPDSYLDWLDAGALRREVLDPLGPGGDGTFLPALRDPDTDRSVRADRITVGPRAVVVVAGAFLLGLGLPFDLVVHLAVSPGARARRTPVDEAWTLPAFDRYDAEAVPVALADVTVRYDDPERPAVALG